MFQNNALCYSVYYRSGSVSATSYTSCSSENDGHQVELEERLQVPVLGYEVMEDRARFTVRLYHICRHQLPSYYGVDDCFDNAIGNYFIKLYHCTSLYRLVQD